MAKRIMSLKKHILWIFPLLLVLSFQNCGKPHSAKDQAAIEATATRKLVQDPYEIKFLDHYKNRYYTVDMETGYMNEFDLGHVQGKGYCLSELDIRTLKGILKDAEICYIERVDIPEDVACTMAMIEPYASLQRVGEAEIMLGSASDGCGNNSVNLCGNKASQLHSFVAATLANLINKNCFDAPTN